MFVVLCCCKFSQALERIMEVYIKDGKTIADIIMSRIIDNNPDTMKTSTNDDSKKTIDKKTNHDILMNISKHRLNSCCTIKCHI